MREIMRFFQFILSYYTRSKENKDLFYTLTEIFGTSINPIRPCGVGGGRGGGGWSARADFNFRELPRYLSNTYQMWPLLLKFIGKQDSGKYLRQRYHMLPWQPRFRRHVYSNFDFLNIFLH